MTGRKLKLLGEDRREQQQYIDSGAETLTSAAGYFSGRIQELGEKVECMQGHMDVERELRHLRVLADCILLDVRGRCGEQRYQSALNNLHDRLDWGLSPAWAELRYYAEFVIDYAEDFQELARRAAKLSSTQMPSPNRHSAIRETFVRRLEQCYANNNGAEFDKLQRLMGFDPERGDDEEGSDSSLSDDEADGQLEMPSPIHPPLHKAP